MTGADRAVGRIFAALGLGEAGARLVSFAATVWIAHRLGPAAYGIVAVAAAVTGYFTHVADFSIEVIGARELAASPASVDRLAPPLVVTRLLIAAACIAVLCVAGLVFMPQPDGAVLAAMSFLLLGTAASTRFVFVGIERPVAASLARVGGALLAFLAVVLVARDAADLGRVPFTSVLGDGVAALAMAIMLRRRGYALPVHSDPALVRPILGRAAPLVAHAILGLVIFNSDLIFLRVLRDEGTAGLYAAAYTLVSFLLNVAVTYGMSLLPVFTRLASDPPAQRRLFEDAMTQVIAVALPIAAGGCLVASGLVEGVFGHDYAPAALPLRILIWSVVAAWMRTVNTFSLIGLHQQSFVLRTTAWSAAINLVLNALIIPRYGMAGAAAATLATEVLRTGIGLAYGVRFGLAMGFVSRLWRPLLGTAAMAALLWFVPMPNVAAAIGAGAVVYAVMLTVTGGLRFAGGRPALTV